MLKGSFDKRKSDSECLKFKRPRPPGSPGASEGGLVDGAFFFYQKILLTSNSSFKIGDNHIKFYRK